VWEGVEQAQFYWWITVRVTNTFYMHFTFDSENMVHVLPNQ